MKIWIEMDVFQKELGKDFSGEFVTHGLSRNFICVKVFGWIGFHRGGIPGKLPKAPFGSSELGFPHFLPVIGYGKQQNSYHLQIDDSPFTMKLSCQHSNQWCL